MPVLSEKQKRFVSEYLIDLNATQAAIRAGYSAKTARSVGSENLTKPDIAAAIAEAQAKAAEKAEWTAADRLASLKEIFDREAQGDARVAIAAIAEANKMQGSYAPEKREHTGKDGGPIQTENKTWREVLRSEKS
jgi:phage terminase small subunit